MKQNKIFLIGMMGVGKTTIGQLLAKKLLIEFIDTDAQIQSNEGISITSLFKQHGEQYFRKLEAKLIEKISIELPKYVVSCGGGLPLVPFAMEKMLTNGTVVFLDAPPTILFDRIRNSSSRPMKTTMLEFEKLYEYRVTQYERADLKIKALGSPESITEQLYKDLVQFWS
jgi:shikimate kinase